MRAVHRFPSEYAAISNSRLSPNRMRASIERTAMRANSSLDIPTPVRAVAPKVLAGGRNLINCAV